MLFACCKGRVSFASMFSRHPSEPAEAANVQDRGECPFLLVFVGRSRRNGLESDAISLANFEVVGRQFIVRAHLDGQPRAIAWFLHGSPIKWKTG